MRQRTRKEESIEDTPDASHDGSTEGAAPPPEKPKRRRRPKKRPQLQDTFPIYMQEAFFGKSLLETAKDAGQKSIIPDVTSDDDMPPLMRPTSDKTITLSASEMPARPKSGRISIDDAGNSSNPLDDEDLQYSDAFKDLLPLDQDIPQDEELMHMLMSDGDALDKAGDESLSQLPSESKDGSSQDPMDSELLSPHFDIDMGADGLPHMDSQDVDDIFNDVLTPPVVGSGHHEPSTFVQPPLNSLGNMNISPGNQTIGIQQMQHRHQLPPHAAPLSSGMGPRPMYPQMQPPNAAPLYSSVTSGTFKQELPPMMTSDQGAPGSAVPSAVAAAGSSFSSTWNMGDNDSEPTQGQKNVLKWEQDEALGLLATTSPVLYANKMHPNLKIDYPNWSERVKQISKLWRQLPTEARQPFLQEARENRAANRITKAQAEGTARSGKGSDTSVINVNPAGVVPRPPVARPPESDQERQWKNMQAMKLQQNTQQQIPDQQMMAPFDPNSGVPEPHPQQMQHMQQTQQFQAPPAASQVSPGVTRVRTPSGYQDPYALPPGTPRPPVGGMRTPASPVTPMGPGGERIFQTPPPNVSRSPGSREPFMSSQQNVTSPFSSQPKTPTANSPFPQSPGMAQVASGQTPDVYSQQQNSGGPMTPRPQSQPHPPPPLSPAYSPMGSQSSENRFSPAPRGLSRSGDPHTPGARDVSSPFSRPASTGTPTGEFSGHPQQQVPCSPSSTGGPPTPDPYSQMPMTPRPQHQQQPHPGIRQPYDQTSRAEFNVPQPHSRQNMSQQPYDPYAQQPSTPRPSPRLMMPPRAPQPPVDPYSHQPGTPMPTGVSNDPYASAPRTPMPGGYGSEGSDISPDGSGQGGMARQHLRDLLQRQKKVDSPPVRPEGQQQWMDQSGQNRPRMPGSDGQFMRLPNFSQPQQQVQQRHPQMVPQADGFRHPLPPGMRPRMPVPQDVAGFRHPGDPRMMMRPSDPRFRHMPPGGQVPQNIHMQQMQPHLQNPQQQQWVGRMPQGQMGQRMMQPMQSGPYQQMPGQQFPGPQYAGPSGVRGQQVMSPGQPRMLMGQVPMVPRNPMMGQVRNQFQRPVGHPEMGGQQQPQHSTVDLVKQLQDTDTLTEADAVLVEDLDDDELLGLGNDFNILEYADPELDKALGGKSGSKNNIFDEHFDADEREKARLEAESKQPEVPGKNLPPDQLSSEEKSAPSGQVVHQPPVPQTFAPSPSLPPPPYEMSKQPTGGEALQPVVTEERKETPVGEAQFSNAPVDSLLSDYDFERLKADILLDDPIPGTSLSGYNPPQPQQGYPQQHPMQPQMQSWGPPDPHVHHPQQQQMVMSQAGGDGRYPHPQHHPRPLMGMQQQQPYQGQQPMHPGYGMQPRVTGPPPQMVQRPEYHNQPDRMPPPGHPALMSPRLTPRPTTPQGRFQIKLIPEPREPSLNPATEDEMRAKHEYEQWLQNQQKLIEEQQKQLDEKIADLRKTKKTLNAKSRQLKKSNSDLNENEARILSDTSAELNVSLKGLESVKKSCRQHMATIQQYEDKKKNQGSQHMVGAPQVCGPQNIPPVASPVGQVIGSHPRPSHSPMVMGMGPGTPGMGPGTPQSPALMSPSPVVPSPSPSMIHSPATGHHSPAHALPSSPMMQSPNIYQQQQRSPVTTPMIGTPQLPPTDDMSQYGEGGPYQQKERQPPPQQMMGRVQHPGYQQMPSAGYPDQNVQQQQQMSQNQYPQMRHQHPGPYQMRPENPRFIPNVQQPHMRPYGGDMSNQPFGGQMPQGPHPGYHVARRMPPPPYPGQYQQGPSQHQPMPHPQQQHMQHVPNPQMGGHHLGQQQQQMPPQHMHHVNPQFAGQHVPQQQMQPHLQQQQQQQMHHHHSQQPPHPQQQQQYRGYSGPQQGMPPVSQHMSPSHVSVPMPSEGSPFRPSPQNDGQQQQQQPTTPDYHNQGQFQLPSEEQKPEESVGEAKTSMTLNFEEQGSGEENQAVNESIIESRSQSQDDTTRQQSTSGHDDLNLSDLKQESSDQTSETGTSQTQEESSLSQPMSQDEDMVCTKVLLRIFGGLKRKYLGVD